jgi:hypothetical protein
MINSLLIIFLAVTTPNIAIEQYESDLTNEEWEKELEKIKESSQNIANPEDIQNAIKEDKDKWDKFMAEPHDGKMFKSDCNSIGVCEYYWVSPPDMTFNVTNNFGEIRQVSVTCSDGTFANYTAQECQLTKEQIVLNEQIKLFLIAITILAVIVITGIVVFIKTRKKVVPE